MTILARTASGRFPIDAPTPDAVRWRDLAHHLAKLCRYNGATGVYYSVAQHSVLAAEFATMPGAWDSEDARIFAAAMEGHTVRVLFTAVLLHDGEEYVGGDLTRPMKLAVEERAPGAIAAFRDILDGISAAVYAKAGLPWPLPPLLAAAVKRADDRLCATEQRDLTADPAEITFTDGCRPIDALPPIEALMPGPAESLFLSALGAAGIDWRT